MNEQLRGRLATLENGFVRPTQQHKFRIFDRINVQVNPVLEAYTSAFMLMIEETRQVLIWLGPGHGPIEFAFGSYVCSTRPGIEYSDDDLEHDFRAALERLAEEESKPRVILGEIDPKVSPEP